MAVRKDHPAWLTLSPRGIAPCLVALRVGELVGAPSGPCNRLPA